MVQKQLLVINNDSKVESVTVSNGGSGLYLWNCRFKLLEMFQQEQLHQHLMLLFHHKVVMDQIFIENLVHIMF